MIGYLVKNARVSRIPEITLSFNASDDDGVTLRSLEFLSLFDLSDGQQYSLCISGDFCSLT